MKHYRIFLVISMLVLASLACQAVMGGETNGGDDSPPPQDDSIATQEPEFVPPTDSPSTDNGETGGSDSGSASEFPMTADAFNVVDVEDGTLIFYTKLSAEEAMEFYREEYTSLGYTERDILTVVTDSTFSMVFDGDPSGQAVVIQSVDLGDGSRTIAIWLEDI